MGERVTTEASVDVKSIMHNIRFEIKDRGDSKGQLSFEDSFDQKFLADIAEARDYTNAYFDSERDLNIVLNAWNIQPYRQLSGNRLVVCVKKAIRKLFKFYLVPVAKDQSAFNFSVMRLLAKNRRLEKQVASLCDRITNLEAAVWEKKRDYHGKNCVD